MVLTAEARIRNRNSYARWTKLAEFLEKEPTVEEIMREVHGILNDMSAYGSITKACYGKESLDLVVAEMNNHNRPKNMAYQFILAGLVDVQFGDLHLDDNIEMFLDEEFDIDDSTIIELVKAEVHLMIDHLKKLIPPVRERSIV